MKKSIFLLAMLALGASVRAQSMSADSLRPRAGFYFYSQTTMPRVRSTAGTLLSTPPLGFGYFREVARNREWHVTGSISAAGSGSFRFAGANLGVHHRFYSKSLFDGIIRPYLGMGGSLAFAHSASEIPGSTDISRTTGAALSAGLYPGIKVKLSNRLFLDLSIPIELPVLTVVGQSMGGQRSLTSSMLPVNRPVTGVRLGLGFNLFK